MTTYINSSANTDSYAFALRIDRVNDLLDSRDLIAETRPAYRARMQHLAQNRDELKSLTFAQVGALWSALAVLPMDSSISYVDFLTVTQGDVPPNRMDSEELRVMNIVNNEVAAVGPGDAEWNQFDLLWSMV